MFQKPQQSTLLWVRNNILGKKRSHNFIDQHQNQMMDIETPNTSTQNFSNQNSWDFSQLRM